MDAKHLQMCQEVARLARQGDTSSASFKLGLLANKSRAYGSWKPEVAAWRWAEGEVALSEGKLSDARSSFHSALEILVSGYSSKKETYASLLADIYRSLARVSLQLQQWGDATDAFRKSISYAAAVDGEDSWNRVLRIWPALAGAMYKAGDGRAGKELEEGLRRSKSIWGSGSSELEEYIERSIKVLEQSGQAEEAARYKKMLEAAPVENETEATLQELKGLVGLQEAKEHFLRLRDLALLNKKRIQEEMPPVPLSIHLALLGPPGTGKSTVALLAARLYHSLGLLQTANIVTATGGDLSSMRSSRTVNELCDKAQGGVLLLQEAYSIPESKRAETVGALLERMEEERNLFALIVTGYPEPMNEFLDSNPGLRSRFETILDFPTYTKEELLEIFESIAGKYDIELSKGAKQKVLAADGSGGARSMRNLFQASLARQASRIASEKGDLRLFEEADIATSG